MLGIQNNISKNQLSTTLDNARQSFIDYSKEMFIAYYYLIKTYEFEELLYNVWKSDSQNWTNTSDFSEEWWSYFENQSINYNKFEEHSDIAREYFEEYKNWIELGRYMGKKMK